MTRRAAGYAKVQFSYPLALSFDHRTGVIPHNSKDDPSRMAHGPVTVFLSHNKGFTPFIFHILDVTFCSKKGGNYENERREL
jgi:hypothetical protein